MNENKGWYSPTTKEYAVYIEMRGTAMAEVEFETNYVNVSLSALKNAVVWRLADGDGFLNMMEIVKVKKWCPSAQKALECNFKDFRVF